MIFDRHANLKYKYGSQQFWSRGYYVDTVGHNKKAIEEYMKNQLEEDIAADQILIKEYTGLFTGGKNTKAQEKTPLAAACNSNGVGRLFNASSLEGLCLYYALLGLVYTASGTGGFDYKT